MKAMAGIGRGFFLGLLITGASASGADWPQFRGLERDAISRETGLLRSWPEGGPEVLWTLPVAEGFAGAAVVNGRVYFNDYEVDASRWIVRCVTLETGKELWRFGYRRRIRPNHGITRSVPAVDASRVFSLDPKCVLHCLDAKDGKELWSRNLVADFGTTIPAWYNGQSPLLEDDRVIIATGGNALLLALDKESGSPLWQTPNPDGVPMSHASVVPTEIDGVRQYLYTTIQGPVGISAADGSLLWKFPWKFNVSVPTSPLPVGDGMFFYTSCYEAETVMIRVRRGADGFTAEKVFSLRANEWNSETHTPILHEGHMFAVGKKRRGLFTCLDLTGKQVWTSRDQASFGLGSYVLADGMFFLLEGKTGVLRLLEANTTAYKELASAKLLSGPEVWAPLALSDGKLIIRDLHEMKCLRVGGDGDTKTP